MKPEVVMNWEQIQGKWKQYSGKAQEKWQADGQRLQMIRGSGSARRQDSRALRNRKKNAEPGGRLFATLSD